jgi:haloacid dehalogenase-like hydrolase
MRIAASNPGSLLGPDAGIELPTSLLDGIHAGGGTLVLSGEPRTGKSRLPAVAAAFARDRAAEIATIGDAANDLPMFARCGLSIGMGNASPDARRATTSNLDERLASAVERFVLP